MKYYTIYSVTNNINGKIYIGKHQTKNIEDGYMGSGRLIREAIKKYGRDNFTKKILFVFDNEEDMNLKEKELVTEEFVSNKKTYNIGVGGEGGPHFKGKTHTKESIKKRNKTRFGFEEKIKPIKEKKTSVLIKKEKYVMTEEHKRKIAIAVKKANVVNDNVKVCLTCPHCNKTGQKLAMIRHHFSNCKYK